MIAIVRGRLLDRGPAGVTLDVGGVGLHVLVPGRGRIGEHALGDEVTLYTHLNVRETALELYGFETPDERGVFRALIAVSGVGPRTALAVLSRLDADEVVTALQGSDVDAFVRAPGVGKKTAQRIVLELSERFDMAGATGRTTGARVAAAHDAIQGLVTLGYGEAAAQRAVTEARSRLDAGADAAAIIREALRALARR
jgi:Holliday junction DNA helicase RuvA